MNWASALDQFKLYLKIERGLSNNTIANYEYDLLRLVKYLGPDPEASNLPQKHHT
jgi:integrase/recombinase XerD